MPRVTALIDTYNHERFIAEAIESVLAQDFPASEMEILVVDDGSTDRTPEIIRSYGSRVRHIRKENGGQASALNLGFAEARGEIVAMLDGDDVWLPHKVRRVVEAFQQHPQAVMVYHPLQYWNLNTGAIQEDSAFPLVSGFVLSDTDPLLRYGDFSTSAMAFRRSTLEELLPIPERLTILADGYLGGAVVFLGPVVGFAERLTRYRVHSENLCSFQVADPARQAQRVRCSKGVAEEVRAWACRKKFDDAQPGIAAYLKRLDLVADMVRFMSTPPGRIEYLRYLRQYHDLYRPLWTRRYRLFHRAITVLACALGYRGFMALRNHYRQSSVSLRMRSGLFPALREQPGSL